MAINQRTATRALRAFSGASYQRRTQGPAVESRIGVITQVVTGPPKTVHLMLGATELTDIHYVASYTPTIGDNVEIRVKGTDLLVLGEYA